MSWWSKIITAASSFWGLLALVLLVFLTINLTVLKRSKLFTRLGQQNTFRIINRVLNATLVVTILLILNVLIKTSCEQITHYKEVTTQSSKIATETTFKYEQGKIIGQVSALDIGADPHLESTLEACFTGSITNLWNRSISIKKIEAIRDSNHEVLAGFTFDFKQEAIRPNDRYEFAGSVRVSNTLFNQVIRPFRLMFRVTTNAGEIVLPSEVYNLDVKAAVASKLLTGNRIKFGDKEGTIELLNCEKAAKTHLCEYILKQLIPNTSEN